MQSELIEQFIIYNKKELYQWFIISMLHPSNQKFGIRYELLIHTLLSIDEDKFLNDVLTKEKFEKIIFWVEKEYSSSFVMMEDYEPFNQRKLIPLLLDGQKYYFFYGSVERPYESLKQLYEVLFSIEVEELKEIKNEFLLTLTRQTDILTSLVKDDESKMETDLMYIPTLDFFNKYKYFFEVKNINQNYLHNSLRFSPLENIEKAYNSSIDTKVDNENISFLYTNDIKGEDSSCFYEMGINNFNGLYTQIGEEYFYTPFETHIEIIYHLIESLIYNNDFYPLNIIKDHMKQRIIKILSYFFGRQQMILGLMDKSNNIKTKYFDAFSFVDSNKVIFFKFLSHPDNLNDSLDDTAKQSFEELQKIKQFDELFAFRHVEGNKIEVRQTPIDISESKVIIVFEKLAFNYMLGFSIDWKEKDIFIYNSLDIKPILELFSEKKSDTHVALLQYLNAEKLQSSHGNNPFQMDALDSFSIYYKNESFAIMGQQPDLMMFDTHSWSDFYHEYLYKKYQDNIYELVEINYPNKFNCITHLGNATYECIDTSRLDGARCVKYNNRLIWISYPPNGFNLNDEEIRISMFLGEFFSFYIDRYKEKLFPFLEKHDFNINSQDLMIVIFLDSLIKQNKNLEHLLPYAEKINDNENLIFYSQMRKLIYNEIFVATISTSKLEKLEKLFGYKDNFNPEKYIFTNFIISLLTLLAVQNKEQVAREFVENIWDLEERAFILKSAHTNNPKSTSYLNPLKIQRSFISNVNQEMVVYLKELKIEIKSYWEEDAKQLNNLIFEFLQKRLEEEIAKFDSSLLIYTYTQIEYIEGKREKDKKQMEFDVQKYIAFDINERHNKNRREVSELAISAKHILHSILKVNPKGYKKIVDSDWYYLMAFSKIINETIQRSDQLHYRLVETGIEITHSYELIDIDKSSEIDFSEHYKKATDLQIISSKNKSINEEPSTIDTSSKASSPFDEQLNKEWKKEYGFYLEDMIKTMMVLGRYYDDIDNLHSPLFQLSSEEIFQYLKNILREAPSVKEIKKILDFLSLDFMIYKDYKYIDYSIDRLMRKKERLNLSPFIKIDDRYLFGHQQLMSAIYNWHDSLVEGDLPFYIHDDSSIKKELERIHSQLDKDLEMAAYKEAVKAVGENFVRMTIDKFKMLSEKFPQKPPCGEIDLLVANINTKTIFVLDAKNVNRKFHISAIDRELNKFFKGRKPYLEKLNKKFDFIKDNQDEILNHFKITDKTGWKIEKGFVVNTLYVSASYKEKINFILIDNLNEFLQS